MAQPLKVSFTTNMNPYTKLNYCALNSSNAQLCYDQDGNSLIQPMTTDNEYNVVGISDTDNQCIHIGYSGGTIKDSLLYTSFVTDVDALKFYYLDIRVDPLCDITTVFKTMDTFQTLSSQYDLNEDDTAYLDPTIYQSLAILVMRIIAICIMACYGFNHKQTTVIKWIYTHHHYPYRK